MSEKFYITTAIAYTSRKPHIGNTYEVVLTDAIARYKRERGYDVFFLTGTDEHGQKIQQLADEQGIEPQKYVDGVAGEIREIWDLMNTSYDKFIRTTDDYHVKAVQRIFKKFYDQGDIYKSEYEGWYCVPCESFFTETQLVDGCCPDCGRKVEKTKEESYFFKMSKYQDKLLKHIEENPDFIQPESRKREMVNNFLKPGLQDLCVSRTSFKWGIPVEFDDKHVVYVWIDALSNYITALGFDGDKGGDLYNKYWPADVHVIGKDILRFHTIYWPIMLMALGQPLPKKVFGHPWLLSGNDKMSKSKGNVMYADDLVRHFGVDAMRYYLLSEMPFAQDGTITYETIIARFNSELANTLGNLVNRSVSMVNKYFDGQLYKSGAADGVDEELKAAAMEAVKLTEEKMDEYKVADALEAIFSLARRSNKYIDETMPWSLAKDETGKERLKAVMYNLIESIRFIAVLLKPFMPSASAEILKQINCEDLSGWDSLATFGAVGEIKVGTPEALFARIDEAKKLEEIESEMTPPAKDLKLKEEISIEDFAKLDLRVAKVVAAEKVEKADKLLKLTLDLAGNTRTIVSGIAKSYKPEDMVGKNVIVIANLKPAKIRGVESHGMLLAASDGDDILVCTTDGEIESGTAVS
ncbi:MAG: methionine--tRNA ligase [Clostridia bacterium]|nr:methionine--tRNA ligase [Clostridia bacterium]